MDTASKKEIFALGQGVSRLPRQTGAEDGMGYRVGRAFSTKENHMKQVMIRWKYQPGRTCGLV